MFWFIDGHFNITKMPSFISKKHFLFSWYRTLESSKEGKYRKSSIKDWYIFNIQEC